MTRLLLAALLALAACTAPAPPPPPPAPAAGALLPDLPRVPVEVAARNFVAVAEALGPVAERTCRQRAPRANCDFRIVVDPDLDAAPNAWQTLDEAGQPVLAFSLALIAEARTRDEVAFIMGHEAAHHIEGHIPRTQNSAMAGALILGTLASLGTAGAPEAVAQARIEQAARLGATLGARSFSKDYELEADALGTLIALEAGFDPAQGALFFARVPDPGNRFLGSHPPNAARLETVRRTLAGLGR